MTISPYDLAVLSQARDLIDAQPLNHNHRLEYARAHLLLIDEIEKGLSDVEMGRFADAKDTLLKIKCRRGA